MWHHSMHKQKIDIVQHACNFQRFDIGIIIVCQHIFQFAFRLDMNFGTRSQLPKNDCLPRIILLIFHYHRCIALSSLVG